MHSILRRAVVSAIGGTALLVATASTAVAAPPDIIWTGAGHIGIQRAVVSPDGQILATASQDDTIKLWRVSDRQLVRTLTSHNGIVYSVAFSPDGRFLASGGEFVFGDPSGNVKLWRVSDGALLGDFTSQTSNLAFSVSISPDGSLLGVGYANGAQGGVVNIFRMSDRSLVRTLVGHTDSVFSVDFSPDGTRIASASADQTVKVWQVSTGRLLRTLRGHTFFVSSVDFSPDGSLIASGSWDKTVKLWNTSNFRLVRTITATTESVESVEFSRDSQTFATGSGDFLAKLWRTSNGALLRTFSTPGQHVVSTVSFIGSKTLVTGSQDSHIRLWDAADGALLATFGKHTGSIGGTVTFSPDGTLFVSGSDDTTVRLWDAASGKDVVTLTEHPDVINQVAFSPSGKLMATVDGSPGNIDSRIKLWETGSPTSMLTIPGHQFGTTGVGFSADGQTLITTGRDQRVRTWRVSDGAPLAVVATGRPVGEIAMSPDHTIAAIPGTGGANLYDPATGAHLRLLGGHATTESPMSFSGGGKSLAVGVQQYGNNVEIIDVTSGSIRTLPGDPDGFVQGVAFALDNTTLVSGSGFSRRIQLWDPATGALQTSYDQEIGWGPFVNLPIAFSPGNDRFGYGRSDATVVMARHPS